ncbi:CLUMA_CG020794, isoform A [Clunio marinus]|uniref:CLUMA_CG020794, isoform A n=1 Tax=Clunio marinus TaxID=568069 RepID=A0A1J1J617_9DIPT|nr:CLUMA_CG020794, isoform A [Clunio marinus]
MEKNSDEISFNSGKNEKKASAKCQTRLAADNSKNLWNTSIIKQNFSPTAKTSLEYIREQGKFALLLLRWECYGKYKINSVVAEKQERSFSALQLMLSIS